MLDFLGNFSSVLITFIVVVGFVAIAGVVVFEFGTLLYFWIKHSLSDSTGERNAQLPTRTRHRFGGLAGRRPT